MLLLCIIIISSCMFFTFIYYYYVLCINIILLFFISCINHFFIYVFYICILQNEDSKDNKNILHVCISIYHICYTIFVYKIYESKFYQFLYIHDPSNPSHLTYILSPFCAVLSSRNTRLDE